MKEQVPANTRWPSDPRAMLERANVDCDFAEIMSLAFGNTRALTDMRFVAAGKRREALAILEKEAEPK